MKRFVAQLFQGSRHRAQSASTVPAQQFAPLGSVPRYPPFDRGLPLVAVDDLLSAEAEQVRRIRDALALSPDDYNRLVHQLLSSLTSYVQLLPMTRAGAYRSAGGMLRHALDVARHAVQLTDATVLESQSPAEKRRRLEPLWRYAIFVAALTRGTHHIVSSMTVTAEDGTVWQPLVESLSAWAIRCRTAAYHLCWRTSGDEEGDRSITGLLLPKLLPSDCLAYLTREPSVLTALLSSVSGNSVGAAAVIHRIVEQSHNAALRRDLESNPEYQGAPSLGAHLEPHIVGALRDCVRAKKWATNQKRGLLWHGKQGTFLVWPPGATALRDTLIGQGVPGIPVDATTLAELLVRYGIALPNPDNPLYPWQWRIKAAGQTLKCVRFARPALLWPESSDEPAAVDVIIKTSDAPAAPDTPAQSGQPAPATEGSSEPTTAGGVVEPATDTLPLPFTPDSEASTVATPAKAPKGASSKKRASKAAAPGQQTMTAAKTEGAPQGGIDPLFAPFMQASKKAPSASAENSDQSGSAQEPLLGSLDTGTSQVLQAIAEDIHRGKLDGQFAAHSEGLAIAFAVLGSYGLPADAIARDLAEHGWLWIDPMRPGLLRVPVEIKGKRTPCIVIETHKARAIAEMFGK